MILMWNKCSFLSLAWILANVKCQFSDNTPPTMWLDRNWMIQDTAEPGSVIVRVHGSDNENDDLVYGLEPKYPGDHIPFKIDKSFGVVSLNESIKGRGGENMSLYVTLSDGHLAAKTEVFVNILNSTSNNPKTYRPNQRPLYPQSFLPYNFNQQPQRPPVFQQKPFPEPPPGFPQKPNTEQQKTYPDHPESSTVFQPKTYPEPFQPHVINRNSTHLLPVDNNFVTTAKSLLSTEKIPETVSEDEEKEKENRLPPVDEAVKSVPDLTITLVPVISVCIIFLTVGVIALLFRKKICLGRTKSCKEDMRKDSGGMVIQDDLAMQQWRGPRAHSNRYEPWDRDPSTNPTQGGIPPMSTPPPNDRWEYPRHRLKFFNILGEGAFGQVWKCEAIDLDGKEGISIVAVKTLKENASEKERTDLVSELKVMKMLEPHPNVVRLLGCCTEKDPTFLIMEFVANGKLQSFLRNSRAERYYNNMHGQSKSLTSRDLTSFVYQVAKGMEFLAANGIIHRDLAARNILINEEHTCKVADFGFARDVIDSHVYERKSEGRLPIRWMAPESLYDNIFSTKSDVWSFGVLIWEVVTLGSTPYPGLSAAEVMRKVRDGHRLDKPEHCRRELYNIMYYCWDKDPKARPSFTECIELLEKLLMTETDYIELERFPDHSYYNMLNLSDEKL